MQWYAQTAIRSFSCIMIIWTSPGGAQAPGTSFPGPTNAQNYAATVNDQIDAVVALSKLLPSNKLNEPSKSALDFAGEKLKQQLDARARAERVMTNPQNAFLDNIPEAPDRVEDRDDRSAACPATYMACNPLNVSALDVVDGKVKKFVNECSVGAWKFRIEDGSEVTPVVTVECIRGMFGWRYEVKKQSVLRPGITERPVKATDMGTYIQYTYDGMSFVKFCQLCKPVRKSR